MGIPSSQIRAAMRNRPNVLPVNAAPKVKIPRGMNGTECAYADQLNILQAAKEVRWWRFEPVRFRISASAFYRVDFMVWYADGVIECVEIKGHEREAAIARWKVAADTFPWATWKMIRRVGGAFEVYREIAAGEAKQ